VECIEEALGIEQFIGCHATRRSPCSQRWMKKAELANPSKSNTNARPTGANLPEKSDIALEASPGRFRPEFRVMDSSCMSGNSFINIAAKDVQVSVEEGAATAIATS